MIFIRQKLFIALVFAAMTGMAAPARFVITASGAVGDGATLNTKAIQSAIDRCATNGGGVVVVPEGIFLSGAIFFKPHVSLLVEKNGVLKGSTNLDDYPLVKTRWEGEERDWTSALVNFFNLTNVILSGEGTIDGSGADFPPRFRRAQSTNDPVTLNLNTPREGRPRLIALQSCRDVRVSSLHLKDEASWGLFMVYCEDVLAENLVIRAAHTIPSSDGMDIDSCNRVRVTGCDIECNDDCISIKSGKDADGLRVNRPSENILIEKTRFGYGHGGVAMGSEVSGGIRHVLVRDCVVDGNWAPIRFKSQPSRGGVVEDVEYRNIEIRNARTAFEFSLAWRMVPPLAPPAKIPTQVRNVRLVNITGAVNSVGVIHGLTNSFIRDVKFLDCHLTAQRGLVLTNTRDIDTAGLKLEVQDGAAIMQNNSTDNPPLLHE